jgi:translation initiation factor 3 subunit I
MRLWNVRTGQCIKTWEFPTAVKRVAWSEDDSKVSLLVQTRAPAFLKLKLTLPCPAGCTPNQILAVTEQRMGHKGAVRVFEINRESPEARK